MDKSYLTFKKQKYICVLCESQEYSELFSAPRLPYKTSDLKDKIKFLYVRCNNCGLVSQYPVVSEEFLNKLYEEDCYPYDTNNLMEYLIMLYYHIERRIGNGRCKKILDIGAGDGRFLDYARRRGWEVYGCDISERARNIAKYKRQIKIVSMQEAGNFPDKYFDLITLYHALEHIEDPGQILSLIKNKLKDDGNCIILIPVLDSWEYSIFKEKLYWIAAPYHHYLYTVQSMRMLTEKNNFKIIEISNDWHNPLMFTLSIFQIFERVFKIFIPLLIKKIIAAIILPFTLPIFILAAILNRSSIKVFYLQKVA